ncbi:MAG: addiction module protein [Nitrospirota bacterium]
MSKVQETHNQAMELSASERACLAHDLILSLDNPSDLELDTPYEIEIQRRVQQVREGIVTGRPAHAVFTYIRAKTV